MRQTWYICLWTIFHFVFVFLFSVVLVFLGSFGGVEVPFFYTRVDKVDSYLDRLGRTKSARVNFQGRVGTWH